MKTTMPDSTDPFAGAATPHESPSIFANLEPGQSARGIYLGTVPGQFGEQPIIYSPKGKACFVWPTHILLLGCLAEVPAYSPVQITREASKSRAAKYTVKSWPVVAATPEIEAAMKECLATLTMIRGKGAPAGQVAGAVSVPVDGAAPNDDDLPF